MAEAEIIENKGFEYLDGILHADNIPVNVLASAYGTPAYVYSAAKIRENVVSLQSAFKKLLPENRQPLIAYACKTNSNIAILRILSQMGLGSDIVSGGELDRCLLAGIDTSKIVYSGVGKNEAEITKSIHQNILQINVESLEELEHIIEISRKMGKIASIALRFNPDVDAKTHAKISTGKSENKFGLSKSALIKGYKIASQSPHINLRGISIHIGSQLTKIDPFRKAFEKLALLTNELRSMGFIVYSLDLGGGLGITYTDETPPDVLDYALAIKDVILPLNTEIIVEPGRLLTGNAGILLSRVLYVKHGDKKKHVILDAGMNDLIRPALYGAIHPVIPASLTDKRPMMTYEIVGPICESSDTFLNDALMPELRQDDLVCIKAAGAHGFVMASNYNTKPFSPEILVDGHNHAIIKRRQTVEDLLNEESIPSWV
jgi:diaminopimelate decarboxylase